MVVNPQAFEQDRTLGEPFNRIKPSDLVDFDDYLPYLEDHPDTVPLQPGRGNLVMFKSQHAHFTETTYRQLHISNPDDRDKRLIAFRNLSYFQIIMRPNLERQLHFDKEPEVKPPPMDTIERALDDVFDIDLVGAATRGIQEANNPKPLSSWEEANYEPLPEIQALSRADRIKFFEAKREEALNRILSSPQVLPPRMITSGLKRVAVALRDPLLESAARERLRQDETYYPLRVPKNGTFHSIAGSILMDAVGIKELESAKVWLPFTDRGRSSRISLVNN